MSQSPYSKAKQALEKQGYTVGKCEHWNAFAKIRVDLFGCIDLICLRAGSPLIAVQVTSKSNVSARMKKAQKMAHAWVSTGNRFQVIGYESRKDVRIMEMNGAGEWEVRP